MSNQWLSDIEGDILKSAESASQAAWFKTADVLLSEVKRLMLEVSRLKTRALPKLKWIPAHTNQNGQRLPGVARQARSGVFEFLIQYDPEIRLWRAEFGVNGVWRTLNPNLFIDFNRAALTCDRMYLNLVGL